MKVFYLIILSIHFINTYGRLIEKNTDKPAETEATESPTPIRVSRQAFYDDGIGLSKEDNTQEEDLRPYVRKGRYSMKSKSSNTKSTNVPSGTPGASVSRKQTEVEETQTKPPKVLIKKPIPKFNEVDYEDFQGKMNKSPAKIADSGEHEDEDFNLDDYEFDVNHDEFVGRGKPLEPRTKVKDAKSKSKKSIKSKPTLPPPEIKIQSKVVIPTEKLPRGKKLTNTKKAAHKMKEDYYDDIASTTKVLEKQTKRELDEDSEDAEDSKEYIRKNPSRVARSPWLVKYLGDRMGAKTADVMSKIFDHFPIMPYSSSYTFSETSENMSGEQGSMRDPMTGPNFMF